MYSGGAAVKIGVGLYSAAGGVVRARVKQNGLGAGVIGGGDVLGCSGVGFAIAAHAPTAALVIPGVRSGRSRLFQ